MAGFRDGRIFQATEPAHLFGNNDIVLLVSTNGGRALLNTSQVLELLSHFTRLYKLTLSAHLVYPSYVFRRPEFRAVSHLVAEVGLDKLNSPPLESDLIEYFFDFSALVTGRAKTVEMPYYNASNTFLERVALVG